MIYHIYIIHLFQSLLFWNSVCEDIRSEPEKFGLTFQSLLFWNSVCEIRCWEMALHQDGSFNPCCFGIRSVSFCISSEERPILSFQSLLFWNSVCELTSKFHQSFEYSFNPCCFGIRSVSILNMYSLKIYWVSILVVLEFGL